MTEKQYNKIISILDKIIEDNEQTLKYLRAMTDTLKIPMRDRESMEEDDAMERPEIYN